MGAAVAAAGPQAGIVFGPAGPHIRAIFQHPEPNVRTFCFGGFSKFTFGTRFFEKFREIPETSGKNYVSKLPEKVQFENFRKKFRQNRPSARAVPPRTALTGGGGWTGSRGTPPTAGVKLKT